MSKVAFQRILSSPADINPDPTPLPEDVRRSRRQQFIDRDIAFSKRLAYCGHPVDFTKHHTALRFLCRVLEYSGHGVPWFVVCIAKVATAIPSDSIHFWTNMVYGTSNKCATSETDKKRAFGAFFFLSSRQMLELLLFLALIVDIVVVATIKAIFRRGRPHYAVQLNHAHISPDRFSFPSGHASRSIMMAALFVTRWINDPVSKVQNTVFRIDQRLQICVFVVTIRSVF